MTDTEEKVSVCRSKKIKELFQRADKALEKLQPVVSTSSYTESDNQTALYKVLNFH